MKGVGECGDDSEVRQGLGEALNMCVNSGGRVESQRKRARTWEQLEGGSDGVELMGR